jgi:hypothetical protein
MAPGTPAIPAGDYGIGLCLSCVGDVIAGHAAPPRFAISSAPFAWPPGAPQQMIIAIPLCFEHIKIVATPVPRRPLLVPADGGPV